MKWSERYGSGYPCKQHRMYSFRKRYRNQRRNKGNKNKEKAGVPVGDAFIGRIVNAWEPIDGKGEIKADDYRPD